MIKKIVFALIICSGVSILTDAGAILYAQKIDRSDISVFGRNRRHVQTSVQGRLSLPNIGFVIKASSFVADHFELSVGLRMQHKSVR